ncbi:hypothetical protein A7982_12972 [Minicystis rosea]|nr:hypothetical protein A7982_12972 [Minicystis rosea]
MRARVIVWLSAFATTWLFGAGASRADPPQKGVLSVRLTDLRNDTGRVGCSLHASEKGFPKDLGAAAQTKWCSIASRTSSCSFDPIPAGTYAVACFHDENDNGKLDTNFIGIPKEGVAVSNDAKGTLGPPSFKDAKLVFPGTATEIRVKVKYL